MLAYPTLPGAAVGVPVVESELVPVLRAGASVASDGDGVAGPRPSGVLALLSAAVVGVTSKGDEDEGEYWEG